MPIAAIVAPPAATVTTMPVDSPDSPTPARTGDTTRIALLLPLNSPTLGAPAEALRAGFMAAYERDRAGFTIELVPSGDTPESTLRAYRDAADRNDMVVGPLARSAVEAVAAGDVPKPTLALNHPGTRTAVPPNLLTIGLSIEDEARQVAGWAHADKPAGRALVVTGPAAWQRRIAGAFHDRWIELGHSANQVEMSFAETRLSEQALGELKARMEIDPPDLLFAALDAEQLRQVRAALGTTLPAYGTSSVNPGRGAGASIAELDGVHMLDLPWQVQPDHPAAMAYPRAGGKGSMDMDRLYALGIDAFRVAREMALHPGQPIALDGVTGNLRIDAGRFERSEAPVIYQGGVFDVVAGGK